MYGADDFLPMLTYVVAQCDMPQLDMEIQYMMELLDPSLLQGEGRCCPITEELRQNINVTSDGCMKCFYVHNSKKHFCMS